MTTIVPNNTGCELVTVRAVAREGEPAAADQFSITQTPIIAWEVCEEGPVAAVLSNGERVSANDRIDSDHAPDGRGKAVGHALESRRTGENRKFDGEVFDLSELLSRTVGAARDAAKAKEQAAADTGPTTH